MCARGTSCTGCARRASCARGTRRTWFSLLALRTSLACGTGRSASARIALRATFACGTSRAGNALFTLNTGRSALARGPTVTRQSAESALSLRALRPSGAHGSSCAGCSIGTCFRGDLDGQTVVVCIEGDPIALSQDALDRPVDRGAG